MKQLVLPPNMCMFGRETTCPLDIMYEMPPAIENIPQNMWVWKLKENVEMAHAKVRQNISDNMKRQKRYHDESLSFETFEAGDKVYVYFPVKKSAAPRSLHHTGEGHIRYLINSLIPYMK